MRSGAQHAQCEAMLFELPPPARRADPRTGKNNIRPTETSAQRCIRLYLDARAKQPPNSVDLPWPKFADPIDGELLYLVPQILAALGDVAAVAQRVLRKNKDVARARVFAAIKRESRLSCDLGRLFAEVRRSDQADLKRLALLLRISAPVDALEDLKNENSVVEICPIGSRRV